MFEKWREGIEANIEAWMNSDDGDGNQFSWRRWGRGFYGIPDGDEEEFSKCIDGALNYLRLIHGPCHSE
jgi:hypothetical protein